MRGLCGWASWSASTSERPIELAALTTRQLPSTVRHASFAAATASAGVHVALADGSLIAGDVRLDARANLARALGVEGGTSSDVLLRLAFERWGELAVTHLLGDFAIVWWRPREREVHLLRDPLGVRPLYYRSDSIGVRFSSDSLPLHSSSSGLDRVSLALQTLELHVEDGPTLYEDVKAVPPAGHVCIAPGHERIGRYWQPNGHAVIRYTKLEDYRDDLRQRLVAAIDDRASPHVAITVSGGVDSSGVAGVASARGMKPLLIRSVFPGFACDETPWSDAVARFSGLEIDSSDSVAAIEAFPPEAHPIAFPYNPLSASWLALFRHARAQGCHTVWTGIGADELMHASGYETTEALRAGRLFDAASAAGVLAQPTSPAAWTYLLGRYARALAPSWIKHRLARGPLDELPSGWFSSPIRDAAHARLASRSIPPSGLSLTQQHLLDALGGHHVVNMMLKHEALGAAEGVELDHPLFDRRIVEFVLAIPHELRWRYGILKPLWRHVYRGFLPEPVVARHNTTHFDPYMRAALDRHAVELGKLCRHSLLVELGVIEPWVVDMLVHAESPALHRSRVALLGLESWVRRVVEGPSTAA